LARASSKSAAGLAENKVAEWAYELAAALLTIGSDIVRLLSPATLVVAGRLAEANKWRLTAYGG